MSTPAFPGVSLAEALADWQLVMRSLNRSPETIRTYSTSVAQLDQFADGAVTVDEVTQRLIQRYLTSVLDAKSASTAVTRWGGLLAFFKWATAEGLTAADPMQGVERPAKVEQAVEMLTDEQIRRLLDVCRGKEFDALRDTAIIRVYLTTGARLSEVANLRLEDVDVRSQVMSVMGKGRRERKVHLQDQTALAVSRYLRARARHPKRETPMLWVGKLGPFTSAGVKQMLQRRGKAADVPVHAHLFRHGFAHRWLEAGGSEGGLMAEAGWRSRQMLDRYGKSLAAERARTEHARLNPGGHL